MSKKLSKEDLEQDLLIEYSSRIVHFYNQNKATVWGGGIGIILLIGLTIGYFVHINQQERQAQELLGIAEQSLAQGNIERALYGDEDDFTLGFIQIANNFGRTSAGNLASYYAAVAEFELGNYESALDYMKSFNVPSGIIGVTSITLHANILLELERYEDAARMFDRAAGWDENEGTTPLNLYAAAEAYTEAGMYNEARQRLETILDKYPGSAVATRAERLMGSLAVRS
jgi:tetratricopeptide (TPR) repeat protein